LTRNGIYLQMAKLWDTLWDRLFWGARKTSQTCSEHIAYIALNANRVLQLRISYGTVWYAKVSFPKVRCVAFALGDPRVGHHRRWWLVWAPFLGEATQIERKWQQISDIPKYSLLVLSRPVCDCSCTGLDQVSGHDIVAYSPPSSILTQFWFSAAASNTFQIRMLKRSKIIELPPIQAGWSVVLIPFCALLGSLMFRRGLVAHCRMAGCIQLTFAMRPREPVDPWGRLLRGIHPTKFEQVCSCY